MHFQKSKIIFVINRDKNVFYVDIYHDNDAQKALNNVASCYSPGASTISETMNKSNLCLKKIYTLIVNEVNTTWHSVINAVAGRILNKYALKVN